VNTSIDDLPQAAVAARRPNMLLWIAMIAGVSLGLARIAVSLQTAHFAALGVFPLFLGAAIGLAIVWISQRCGIQKRRTLVLGAVFSAITVAAAEHGLFYLDYCRQFSTAMHSDPKAQWVLAMEGDQFQPATFYRFMAAEAPAKWPLWIADALAMIAVAAVVTWLLSARQHVYKSAH
jgi:hypothetical protein